MKGNTAMLRYADASEYTVEEILLWEQVRSCQNCDFYTSRGLMFTYETRGNEFFISRRDKPIIRATVKAAYRKARLLTGTDGCIGGPPKLCVFGASYLYPVFLNLGLIHAHAP